MFGMNGRLDSMAPFSAPVESLEDSISAFKNRGIVEWNTESLALAGEIAERVSPRLSSVGMEIIEKIGEKVFSSLDLHDRAIAIYAMTRFLRGDYDPTSTKTITPDLFIRFAEELDKVDR